MSEKGKIKVERNMDRINLFGEELSTNEEKMNTVRLHPLPEFNWFIYGDFSLTMFLPTIPHFDLSSLFIPFWFRLKHNKLVIIFFADIYVCCHVLLQLVDPKRIDILAFELFDQQNMKVGNKSNL